MATLARQTVLYAWRRCQRLPGEQATYKIRGTIGFDLYTYHIKSMLKVCFSRAWMSRGFWSVTPQPLLVTLLETET